MNTVILFWNPKISSFKYDDFSYFIQNLEIDTMNWSVWDYKKAKKGDRFFLVKCGESKNNRIYMSGHFVSEPYRGEDWSGKGREVFYMDMGVDTAFNPQFFPVLSAEDLFSAIPNFDWAGGHSGRILNEGADLLEEIWDYFLEKHNFIFKPQSFRML